MGREDTAREARHGIAVVRQAHVAGVAGNQGSPGRGFQLSDMLADRRLRQAQALGRAREAERLGHGQERPELGGFKHAASRVACWSRCGIAVHFIMFGIWKINFHNLRVSLTGM